MPLAEQKKDIMKAMTQTILKENTRSGIN